jgi:hypothetical protein
MSRNDKSIFTYVLYMYTCTVEQPAPAGAYDTRTAEPRCAQRSRASAAPAARPRPADTILCQLTIIMMRTLGLLGLLAQQPVLCDAQTGGAAPPKKVHTKLCSISSVRMIAPPLLCPPHMPLYQPPLCPCIMMASQVFGKLLRIKTAPACRSGCAGGKCPKDWIPGAADKCSAPCGKVFEVRCPSVPCHAHHRTAFLSLPGRQMQD